MSRVCGSSAPLDQGLDATAQHHHTRALGTVTFPGEVPTPESKSSGDISLPPDWDLPRIPDDYRSLMQLVLQQLLLSFVI